MNRAADIAIAGFGLTVSSPFLGLAALAIKLTDRGPVLYRQQRVGKDGADFELLKLRTMVVGAEKIGAGFAVDRGDSRITRAGRLLRRLSLDELPQLWNILRGDMSIVGPRPTLRYQVDKYTPHQRRRLEVRPGLTGWAQVNGRAELPWEERIELDVWYVEHRSARLDLRILLRTPRSLFRGTYKGLSGRVPIRRGAPATRGHVPVPGSRTWPLPTEPFPSRRFPRLGHSGPVRAASAQRAAGDGPGPD